MDKRPIIAVTGPQEGGWFAWIMTWLALRRQGARPVRLRPGADRRPASLHGLVLGGGSDIDPEHYGEELRDSRHSGRHQSFRDKLWGAILFGLRLLFSIKSHRPRHDQQRDDLEKELCAFALAHNLPVLGTRRGAQLINICRGGSLYQDTINFYTETPHLKTIFPRKKIRIKAASRLAAIFKIKSCLVNSLHDQAIRDLGDDLVVSARDDNGIIQAIEHTSHPFMIGVQWHPEYLPQRHLQQRLFQALVEAAQCKLLNG